MARWAEGIEQACIADGSGALASPAGTGLLAGTGQLGRAQERLAVGGAGGRCHTRLQRLLYNYRWDADLVRDDMKSYVVEHLAADAVLDETGFLKKGDKSVGVQPSGTAGRIENCQIGVFLAYASAGAEPCWTGNVPAPGVGRTTGSPRRHPGVPESVGFRTKPQLGPANAEAGAGQDPGWVAGDAPMQRTASCGWLEREGFPTCWPNWWKLWVLTDQGLVILTGSSQRVGLDPAAGEGPGRRRGSGLEPGTTGCARRKHAQLV